MSRYLFGLTDAGGTVPPEVGAVRRMVERGHEVTALGDASMADELSAAGADFRPWSVPALPVKDWGLRSPAELARVTVTGMLVGPAPGHARDAARAIEEVDPDGVVPSFTSIGTMIAADAAGRPYDVLIPNVYALPAPRMPPFGLGLAPARGPLGRLRDRAVGGVSLRVFDRHALEPLNAVRHDHGLGDLAHSWDQHLRARRQLVMTAAAFDFPAELPSTARYVGPVLDDPAWAVGSWAPPPGEGPLVAVAMSSTFQDHVGCLQRIIDALADVGVRGVVTTGPAVDPDLLLARGDVVVTRSAPHALVFSCADLVVTHGGHGSVMKALAAGVPMVVMHHGRDQADNAIRLTRRGAAVAISRTSSSARIARAVRRVLADDGYRVAAARLGAAVRSEAASGALQAELEELARVWSP